MIQKILEDLDGIFIDPISKNKLFLEKNKSSFITKDGTIKYTEKEGIINFLPHELGDQINPYDKYANSYDSWINGTNKTYKILKKFFWGINNELEYTNKVMNFLPTDFNGVILDVPIGTGIFTLEKYCQMKHAKIIAADYSLEMLKIAKQRFDAAGLKNILYVRCDVAALPFSNNSIDIILSMSGIEAFRKKDEAIMEINRALKNNGRFIGCTYIRGKKFFKDISSRISSKRTGLVLKPFFNEEEIIEKFNIYFELINYFIIKSIWCFNSIKK